MKSGRTYNGWKLQILSHERITLFFLWILISNFVFWRRQIVKVLLRAVLRNYDVKKKERGGGETDRFKGAFWEEIFCFFEICMKSKRKKRRLLKMTMLRNGGQRGANADYFYQERSITQIGHVGPSHWWLHVTESPLVSEPINALLVSWES